MLTVENIPFSLLTTTHMKSLLHSQTFNSSELHSITVMLQFLNSIPSLHSSAPKHTSWQAGVSKLDWLSQLTQLAWDPPYITSGLTQQKTLFSNNSFIVARTCLLCRCLAVNVYSGSTIPTFKRHVTIRFLVSCPAGLTPYVSVSRLWEPCNLLLGHVTCHIYVYMVL
jgi:hypothetical protein